jgi:hypothetical protein
LPCQEFKFIAVSPEKSLGGHAFPGTGLEVLATLARNASQVNGLRMATALPSDSELT